MAQSDFGIAITTVWLLAVWHHNPAQQQSASCHCAPFSPMKLLSADGPMAESEHFELITVKFFGKSTTHTRAEWLPYVLLQVASLSALVVWRAISECLRLGPVSWYPISRSTANVLRRSNCSLMILTYFLAREISRFCVGILRRRNVSVLSRREWVVSTASQLAL